MKATGIVRRIDDLGRVVIPKEIRRTMRIRDGDPLEIYIDRDGEVIFKKYSPIGELTSFASQYAETLYKTCELSVLITDRDSVVACAGVPKKEFADRRISTDLEGIIEARSLYVHNPGDRTQIAVEDSTSYYISCAMPIITEGDVIGCVVSLAPMGTENDTSRNHETEIKLIQTAANFLGKQLES
ncbi:MAG TPA: stage V sporulation T C-terminal domain-containing protein [Bacillota bacterium]|nr:AbrB/MazE/SpoVT family DNA-binding domain-containing protein [Clostridiales bacterium]HPT85070.1 stage V sporulation T C-terminal domain-containing protein [Bacillota bacterium]